jgi:large subunit ribosomal protein L4e
MKATLYDSAGKKKGAVELPALFDTPIREDLVHKAYEAEKFMLMQPFSPSPTAGRRHSASGTISHRRHAWGGHYGKGVSRLPRKEMWRRGTQFYWVGAEVSNTRGGRSVHAAHGAKAFRKINQKERLFALRSALAATAQPTSVQKHYASLSQAPPVPAVIESLPAKMQALSTAIRSIFGDIPILKQTKTIRHGKGKQRGRPYKTSAGVLLVTSSKETQTFKGITVVQAKKLMLQELYPLGRITLYTKAALEELA